MKSKQEELIEAVLRRTDMEAHEIAEAAKLGGDKGWSGFTYSHQAAAFFDDHQDLIWSLLCEEAGGLGYENPLQLIASFNRTDMADTFTGLKVLLSWYALEEAGRAIEC